MPHESGVDAGSRHNGGIDAIHRFLLLGEPLPDAETLARHQLTPYAIIEDRDGAVDPMQRDALLQATTRHLHVKATVLPLIRSWSERGIEALVYKGFYLAEFVYEHPAIRFYRDVDLLLREEDMPEALVAAERMGWSQQARRATSATNPHSHTEATLWKDGVAVEVHRMIAHCSSRRDTVQRALTTAAWKGAVDVEWHGTSLRALDPRDCIIMGIALNRGWSGDRWRVSASDYLDMCIIRDRFGVTADAVIARALELRVPATLRLVLQRCDPWQGRLNLCTPSWRSEQLWNLAVVPERGGFLSLDRLARRARGIPHSIRYLPLTLSVHLLLGRDGDFEAFLEGSAPTATRRPTPSDRTRQKMIAGIVWAARIVRPFGNRDLLRSIVLFHVLRHHGISVTLSLAPTEKRGPPRAWVRIDDRPPPTNVIGHEAAVADWTISHAGMPKRSVT